MSGLSKLQAKLAPCFNNPTPEEYWHYLAKNEKNSAAYSEEKIAEKIKQIRDKLGECSFDRQAAHGLTPLLVAVLCQNETAVSFLLSKGANLKLSDEDEKSPLLYAMQAIPEGFKAEEKDLIRIDKYFDDIVNNYFFLSAELRDPSRYKIPLLPCPLDIHYLRQVALRLLPPPIPLPAYFTYQTNTNDFGLELKSLLFVQPKNIKQPVVPILRSLAQIAAQEGFDLQFTTAPHYPRDSFIRTSRGVTSFTNQCKEFNKAFERANSKSAYFGDRGVFCSRMRCALGYLGVAAGDKHLADTHLLSSFTPSNLPVYIEGGNLFTLTNGRGEKKILIGRDHLVQMHAQLRLQKYFDANPPASDAIPSDQEIQDCAEEMYAMGLITFNNKTAKGFLTNEQISEVLSVFYVEKEVDSSSFRTIAIQKGLISPFNSEYLEEAKSAAINYLSQRKRLIQALAHEFGVLPQDICFIPQIVYHLDVFMQPGPKGSIFIQDFNVCIQILQGLLELKTFLSLPLGCDERLILKRYLATAQRLAKELGPLLKEAQKELEKAGFAVIPTPGIFYDQHYDFRDETFHINFFNAITGWSEKQKHNFYITTGTSVGTHLGSCLMEIFKMFLQQYDPQLAVHYAGENPDQKGDFSQTMECWNVMTDREEFKGAPMAGLHCMSFEKEQKQPLKIVPPIPP